MNPLVDVVVKYVEFLGSHDDEVRARARELKVPEHTAAAALFAIEEVRQSREVRLDLGVTSVDPHTRSTIEVQHLDSRPDTGPMMQVVRLEVPPEVAEHFRLVDLTVGRSPVYFPRPGTTWPVMVSEVMVAEWREGDFLRMGIENIDCDPREFTGVAVCWKL